ncbi:MAG: hypothetical protein HYR63_09125 [Proteobacteria bacterium]|nr:hypothetical protein [Pseudomonadota bacterium]
MTTSAIERLVAHPFRHGALYYLKRPLWLADSYHCSRYNTNTVRLTEAMFAAVLANLRSMLIGSADHQGRQTTLLPR